MHEIGYITGSLLIPATLALFVTALVAGRKALRESGARVVGLIGIALVAVISAFLLNSPFVAPIIGSIILGVILRRASSA